MSVFIIAIVSLGLSVYMPYVLWKKMVDEHKRSIGKFDE